MQVPHSGSNGRCHTGARTLLTWASSRSRAPRTARSTAGATPSAGAVSTSRLNVASDMAQKSHYVSAPSAGPVVPGRRAGGGLEIIAAASWIERP
jgi:hypothetical protein